MRQPTSLKDVDPAKRQKDSDRVDSAAEEALARGSFLREAKTEGGTKVITYEQAFGEKPGAEPSQDNSEIKLVRAALALLNEPCDQVSIAKNRAGDTKALIIRDDVRTEIMLDGVDTPETLAKRLGPMLDPIRWPAEKVAEAMQADMNAQAERMVDELEVATGRKPAPRIERGGLEEG